MKVIEWPPGSGRRAVYNDDELGLVNALMESCDASKITPAEAKRQTDMIHDLKVELDATMLPEPVVSEDGSPFERMIPRSVQRQLLISEGDS